MAQLHEVTVCKSILARRFRRSSACVLWIRQDRICLMICLFGFAFVLTTVSDAEVGPQAEHCGVFKRPRRRRRVILLLFGKVTESVRLLNCRMYGTSRRADVFLPQLGSPARRAFGASHAL